MLEKLFKQFLSSDVFLLEQQGIRCTCIDFVMANVCGQEHAVGKMQYINTFLMSDNIGQPIMLADISMMMLYR